MASIQPIKTSISTQRRKEKWKPVRGYEGLYDVSSYGRVRSYPRNGTKEKGLHILSHSINKRGYHKVTLFKNDKPRYQTVHSLVAESFLSISKEGEEVNHIDGNPSNNKVENLEWVSKSENHIHRVYVLGKNPLKKCRKVLCIETGIVYPSIRSAARDVGCNHKSILRAARGIYSQANNLHWKYY